MINEANTQKLNFVVAFIKRAQVREDSEAREYEDIRLAYYTLEEVFNDMKEDYERRES